MKDGPVRKYLSRLGRKGGSSRSAAKVAASRENGKKGGRPRKNPVDGGMNAAKKTR